MQGGSAKGSIERIIEQVLAIRLLQESKARTREERPGAWE